jgi:hypothetical protein
MENTKQITIRLVKEIFEAMDSFSEYYVVTQEEIIDMSLRLFFHQEIRMMRLKKKGESRSEQDQEDSIITNLDFRNSKRF